MMIIFDMEGVLVDGELLPELAKLIKKEKEVEEITLEGIRGDIDWETGLRRRIEILKGIEKEKVEKVADNMELMKNAKKTCRELKKMDFTLVSVTGGFDVLAERIKEELGLDYVFANEMIFNGNKLSKINLNVNSDKRLALKDLIEKLDEDKEDVITVVEGANDLSLFEVSGLKIAFNAQEMIEEKADIVIEEKDLSKLIPLISKMKD